MSALPVAEIKVISSVDLVEVINRARAEEGNRAKLRHDHFLTKIEKVLGEAAPNFRGSYIGADNTERPCYYLPMREAHLMSMSESYKVQAAVYDRMVALENRLGSNIDELMKIMVDTQRVLANGHVEFRAEFSQFRDETKNELTTQRVMLTNVVSILDAMPQRRRNPRAEDRKMLIAAVLTIGHCPMCAREANGLRFEIDHFHSVNLASIDNLWPICVDCHTQITNHRVSRNEITPLFQAFHLMANRRGLLSPQKRLEFGS